MEKTSYRNTVSFVHAPEAAQSGGGVYTNTVSLTDPIAQTPDTPGSWIDHLNPAQRLAATYGAGFLLVVAGAGTGKTMTLACRVASLIERGVPPERILLLTFTRRAAHEMLSRAARLIGASSSGAATGRVWGGTFHAVANRLLRHHGRAVGIRPDFTVVDQSDGADLMNLIRGDLGLATRERRFPRKDTLASIYSRMVNAGSPLEEVLKRHYPWCVEEAEGIREIFRLYTERKRRQNVLDFDDLLLYWNELATAPLRLGSRDADSRLGDLFDHILVDEYQDTNALQAEILAGMRSRCTNVTVVGDDAQAIYSFRSATVKNILEFPERFPRTTIVKLEENYRSTQHILAASNAVIALSPQRHEKTLWSGRQGGARPLLVTCQDEAEQCEFVCGQVLNHREQGIPLKQQAVLFRAAHHSDQLEVELTRRNIPYVKYGGLRFLEAAHVKDLMATLRILENPWDETSWFRILQLLEGVGPVMAAGIMEELGVRGRPDDVGPTEEARDGIGPEGDDVPSPVRTLQQSPPRVPVGAREGFEALRAALSDCGTDDLPPATQIERLRSFLELVFERRYLSLASRIKDLEQLEQIASRYPTRARFIVDLTLDPPASTSDLAGQPLLDEDYLILSTIHSAKGLEWDVVYVIHAADGMIPSDMATGDADEIEEERRLLYVALTRARNDLYVSFPLRYYQRPRGFEDGHGYAQLTRFLPQRVREFFERRRTFEETPETPDVSSRGAAGAAGDRAEGVASYLSRLLGSPMPSLDR